MTTIHGVCRRALCICAYDNEMESGEGTSQITARAIVDRLREGGTVILPTETVYGLAIQPGNPEAARRAFELKGRPRDLNLPVIIGSPDQLEGLGVDVNALARRLADRFWPGPLTLVMGFTPARQRAVWLEGRDEVAIRLPGLKLLRDIAQLGGPFLMTSANAHGTGSQQTAEGAVKSLLGEADLVVNGGVLTPTPSTIINTRPSPGRVERMGSISAADLSEFVQSGDLQLG